MGNIRHCFTEFVGMQIRLIVLGSLFTICFSGSVSAMDVGGFVGVPIPYEMMTAEDCRACHDNPLITDPTYLPDRHHLYVDTPIPEDSDAPNGDPNGDGLYECLSCHEMVWNPTTLQYDFAPYRDCLLCHDSDSGGSPPPVENGNLALNKPVEASRQSYSYPATNAVDGNASTRWVAYDNDNEWIRVDLQGTYSVNKVVISWHSQYARDYRIRVSTNGYNWTTVKSVSYANGGTDTLTFTAAEARYVMVYCERARDNYFSIYEFEVYQDTTGQNPPGSGGNTVHHKSAQAQVGSCTYCHRTPSFAFDRPEQAACRQCHGKFMHDNGGPIQDYGACASCHNDSTEPAPIPPTSPNFPTYGKPETFHAKPPRAVGYTVIPGGGGWKAGKGVFALFWCEFTDCGQDQEGTFLEDIEPNGDDMDDEGGYRWSRPSVEFNRVQIINNGRNYSVPSFDGIDPINGAPTFDNMAPADGYTVAGNVDLSLIVNDDRMVKKVVYWIDEGAKVAMTGPDGSSSGIWTAVWDSHYIPYGTQPLPCADGTHTLTMQAEDDQGYVTKKSITINVENMTGGADTGGTGGTSTPPPVDNDNLALNKSVSASRSSSSYPARNAVDGSTSTRWVAYDNDSEWLTVDLGKTYKINEVVIKWHNEYARDYRIRVSTNGYYWTTVRTVDGGNGGTDTLTFSSRDARYVKVDCERADDNYFSIYEVEIYQ